MNSSTKDLIQFARMRGLNIILHQKGKEPFFVEPKKWAEYLKDTRYEWNLWRESLRVFEPGYEGKNSPFKKKDKVTPAGPPHGSASLGGDPT